MSEKPQPTTVGPYRIARTLGEGLMGPVYLGTHQNQYWAVRLIDSSLLQTSTSVNRLVGDVLHEALVRYREIGADPALGAYVVTDYVESRHLTRDALQGMRSPARVKFLRPILEGLAVLHKRGATHGALKPNNVLLRGRAGQYQALVIDAGFIYVVNEQTLPRLLRFAFPTMAPELVEAYLTRQRSAVDRALTSKADIYAAGQLIAETLSGLRAFTDLRSGDDLLAAKRGRQLGVTGVNDPLALVDMAALDKAVKSATEPDPAKRLASIADLIAGLDAVLANRAAA